MKNTQRRHDISDEAWALLEPTCLDKAGNGEVCKG